MNKKSSQKEPLINRGDISRILLVPLCGLGDTICYLPSIKEIRLQYPKARIVVIVATEQSRDIIVGARLDVEVIVYNRAEHRGLLSSLKLVWKLRKQHFDLALTRAPRNSRRIPLFVFLSGARWRIGASSESMSFLYNLKVDVKDNVHSIERYRQILVGSGFNISSSIDFPNLEPPKESKKSADQLYRQLGFDRNDLIVGFASGADINIREKWNPSLKRWRDEEYSKVARWLVREQNMRVVMFGIKREKALVEKISSLSGIEIANLCGKTSIGELQWLLKRCVALVCNDTGTMHLAAALKVPVVALFGPTSPACYGPQGDIHRIIQGSASCSPCFPRPTCKLESCKAMNSIKADQVIGILEEMISKKGMT